MCFDLALGIYIQPPLHEDSDVREKRQFALKEGNLELEKIKRKGRNAGFS